MDIVTEVQSEIKELARFDKSIKASFYKNFDETLLDMIATYDEEGMTPYEIAEIVIDLQRV